MLFFITKFIMFIYHIKQRILEYFNVISYIEHFYLIFSSLILTEFQYRFQYLVGFFFSPFYFPCVFSPGSMFLIQTLLLLMWIPLRKFFQVTGKCLCRWRLLNQMVHHQCFPSMCPGPPRYLKPSTFSKTNKLVSREMLYLKYIVKTIQAKICLLFTVLITTNSQGFCMRSTLFLSASQLQHREQLVGTLPQCGQ